VPVFFLAFIVVPLIEIFIFSEAGSIIGGWNVVLIVLLTGFIGAWCVRTQGLSTLLSAQHKLNNAEIPTEEIINGICIVIAGLLLITPGFLTDFIGFMLFIPPVRGVIWGWLKFHSHFTIHTPQRPRRGYDDENVVDGDFEVLGDQEEIPHKKD
jgi:UPF0716 protein FxsA